MQFAFISVIVLVQVLTGFTVSGLETSKYAIDIHSTNGLHLQFPYFPVRVDDKLPPEIGAQVTQVAINILKYMDDLIGQMLIKKIPIGDWIQVGKELRKITSTVPKEALTLGAKIGFNKYIMDVVKRMTSESKAVERFLKWSKAEKEPQVLLHQIRQPLHGLIEAFEVSPQSVYIAWADGFIDDDMAVDVAIQLMGKLRYHGYSGLLNVMEQVLNLLLVINKFG